MLGHRNIIEKIPIWSVILGVVLLCGVLSMGYGFYENNELALYIGLAVTMLGALNGIFFIVVSPSKLRLPRHGAREGGRQ